MNTTLSIPQPLQVGISLYDGDPPNIMPCYKSPRSIAQRSLQPARCKRPGSEIDFIKLLMEPTQSYTIRWLTSKKDMIKGLETNQIDAVAKIGRPVSFLKKKGLQNMSNSNPVWVKEYCFGFRKPKKGQFLSKFSPFGPLDKLTWITTLTLFYVCTLIAYLSTGRRGSPLTQFEHLFVEAYPVSSRKSYLVIYATSLAMLGILKSVYASRVASQLVAAPIPPHLATVSKLLNFVRLGNYKLYTDDAHRPIYLRSKFFAGSEMAQLYDAFTTAGIGQLTDDSDGYKILANPNKATPEININTFMMPLNKYKGAYLSTRNHDVRLICLLGNQHFAESLPMIKKRTLNEHINRKIERLKERGLVRHLVSRYGGPSMTTAPQPNDSPEALKVKALHYETSGFLLLSVYAIGVVYCLVQIHFQRRSRA